MAGKRGRPVGWTGFHKNSVSQLVYEHTLTIEGEFTTADIARHFEMDSARASAFLNALRWRGLVGRLDDHEGRGKPASWISRKERKV